MKLKDGTKVPGSTTVVGLINKPYLLEWANKLGKDVPLMISNVHFYISFLSLNA